MYKGLCDERLVGKLERAYKALDVLVKATKLEYDVDDDEYYMHNVEECDCDREMLASIENTHSDLGYFLGK